MLVNIGTRYPMYRASVKRIRIKTGDYTSVQNWGSAGAKRVDGTHAASATSAKIERELRNLGAQAPADTSFAALFASMKKSAERRQALPKDEVAAKDESKKVIEKAQSEDRKSVV